MCCKAATCAAADLLLSTSAKVLLIADIISAHRTTRGFSASVGNKNYMLSYRLEVRKAVMTGYLEMLFVGACIRTVHFRHWQLAKTVLFVCQLVMLTAAASATNSVSY